MSEFWFKNDSNGQNFNIKMTLVDWSWTKNYSSEQVLNFFDVLADKYSPESREQFCDLKCRRSKTS